MISRSTTPRRLPPDADGRRNDRRYDARLGVAVGAAKVEEVLVEEPEHVLGEVGHLEGVSGMLPTSPSRCTNPVP